MDLMSIKIDKCKIQRGNTETLYPFGSLKNTFSESEKLSQKKDEPKIPCILLVEEMSS